MDKMINGIVPTFINKEIIMKERNIHRGGGEIFKLLIRRDFQLDDSIF